MYLVSVVLLIILDFVFIVKLEFFGVWILIFIILLLVMILDFLCVIGFILFFSVVIFGFYLILGLLGNGRSFFFGIGV